MSLHEPPDILLQLLSACERKDFKGYSKFDALNSPALERISRNSKWLRLIFTQLVKESPFHVRPMLDVKASRNPKGIALFARAYMILYRKTGFPGFRKKADKLLDWLLAHPSPGQNHLCWGYNFIWQNTIFLQAREEPNVVVTVFAGEALLEAYRLTGNPRYLEAARSIGRFIMTDLPILVDEPEEMAIAYVRRKVDAIVLNNQVLAGAFLIKLWRQTREELIYDTAVRLINFTVRRKTPYHAWYYTHPRGKSPITHDNYHTGGILDGLLEFYEATGDTRYNETYWQGLGFYRDHLFTDSGAPKWMYNKSFPHDIHGSAQGIITFSKAGRTNPDHMVFARQIVEWAYKNLYDPHRKNFFYRKGKYFIWKYSLMRWCNAWMCRALSEFESVSHQEGRWH